MLQHAQEPGRPLQQAQEPGRMLQQAHERGCLLRINLIHGISGIITFKLKLHRHVMRCQYHYCITIEFLVLNPAIKYTLKSNLFFCITPFDWILIHFDNRSF